MVVVGNAVRFGELGSVDTNLVKSSEFRISWPSGHPWPHDENHRSLSGTAVIKYPPVELRWGIQSDLHHISDNGTVLLHCLRPTIVPINLSPILQYGLETSRGSLLVW